MPFVPKSSLPSSHSVAGTTPTAKTTVSASYVSLSVTTSVKSPSLFAFNDLTVSPP